MTTQKINFIRFQLRRWYQRHKRDLPWRKTHDPYKIWVSEIMLQQTQVITVIPYYHRWLKKFPTLASLARANLSEVLRSWAGLGYYRRARLLHEAAQKVQKSFRGKIPQTSQGLRLLPGIGRYTAGAIASIAFGEKTPVLDGNVIRILTRIFGIRKSIDLPRTIEELWGLAALLLPESNPGDMNQALMELGATVCSPLAPQCPKCPVKKCCSAFRHQKTSFFPVRTRKEAYEKLTMTALVLQDHGRNVWIEKQKPQARWGGLWMFPYWKDIKAMSRDMRGMALRPEFFLKVQHGYTKYRISLMVYKIKVSDHKCNIPLLKNRDGHWICAEKLKEMALPSPHKKIAEALL